MKTKTIKKVISKKMNEWIDSLPENLRSDVKDNILVSGGCITSMLLKEDVNDFDIYIQDKAVLLRLAEHYCPRKVLDGDRRLEYLEDLYPDYSPGSDGIYRMNSGEEYVAEHFLRYANLKPRQVKLDIPSVGERYEIEETDADGNKLYLVKFLSQNAISLSNDVQIVLRFSGTPGEIHKTFDFIHATNYFTFRDGLVLNNDALVSILTKDLKYQGSLYPLTSIIRMKKFIGRGWNIGAGEILKIMFQISELDLRNLRILEEQLIGVDVAYFGLLIDALRAVPRSRISSTYISIVIDKIFNEYDGDSE